LRIKEQETRITLHEHDDDDDDDLSLDRFSALYFAQHLGEREIQQKLLKKVAYFGQVLA
jgi:hypothetical protein